MPATTCPHCREPVPDAASACPACGRSLPASEGEGKARSWGSIRIRAPFWAVVSAFLLAYGLFFVDPIEAKGRVVLIAVGAFGLLCSLAFIARDRIRARRGRS